MSDLLSSGALEQPIPGESPCGPSLDPTELLAFDALRVFGQSTPLDAPLEEDAQGRQGERGRTPRPASSPEWIEIRDAAAAALGRSKDLRVLSLLGAAVLRTDGPYALCRVISTAAGWVGDFWESVHPLATEDSIERQSALSAFNDHWAMVDGVRRAPVVSSRTHGRFSLRDIEQATSLAPIDAAFAEISVAELSASRQLIQGAIQALAGIESRIRESDPEPALSFDGMTGQLGRLERVLRAQLAKRPESGVAAETTAGFEGGEATPGGAAVGVIRSRQDAIRALDAVATFFQQTEPSSPVPLLIERARRLVAKSFLEVLADLAPGALGEARTASGVRDE